MDMYSHAIVFFRDHEWIDIERHAPASTRKHAGTGSKRHLCSPPAARVCRELVLSDNDLAALPEGIFAPLTELQ